MLLDRTATRQMPKMTNAQPAIADRRCKLFVQHRVLTFWTSLRDCDDSSGGALGVCIVNACNKDTRALTIIQVEVLRDCETKM